MSWKCPECGKKLKAKGTHPQTHQAGGANDLNAIEEFLSFGPQLGGENGRLRALRNHDQTRDWDSVYHAYNKVSGKADTIRERTALRQRIAAQRLQERW